METFIWRTLTAILCGIIIGDCIDSNQKNNLEISQCNRFCYPQAVAKDSCDSKFVKCADNKIIEIKKQ